MKPIFSRLLMAIVTFSMLQEIGLGAPSPTAITRATGNNPAWLAEAKGLEDCYRKNLKPPEGSKIVPLYVMVILLWGDSIAESGASVHELAFMHAEIPSADGKVERSIRVFSRQPYANREWDWREQVIIVEQGENVPGNLSLDDDRDVFTQISGFSKRITEPGHAGDVIISMVVFDESCGKIFGRKLTDEDCQRFVSVPRR